MDSDRFDALAQSLAPTRSRRAAFGLAAGALAALGLSGATAAEATRHRKKKKCKPGETKCKKACCTSAEACAGGQCVTVQGTCASGADTCTGVGDPFCFDASGKHECICLTRLQGGTRCGIYTNKSTCDQCQSDADCLALGFPQGSSCTQDFGPECQACGNNNFGTCIIPCGFKKRK